MSSKKAQAGFALLSISVTSLLIIIIAQAIGGDILSSFLGAQCVLPTCDPSKWGTVSGENMTYSAAFNITNTGSNAFLGLANWNTTIVAVVAAVVILSFVMLLRGSKPESQ